MIESWLTALKYLKIVNLSDKNYIKNRKEILKNIALANDLILKKYDQAIHFYYKIIKIIKKNENTDLLKNKELATLYSSIGICHFNRLEYEDCAKVLNFSWEIFIKIIELLSPKEN